MRRVKTPVSITLECQMDDGSFPPPQMFKYFLSASRSLALMGRFRWRGLEMFR